MKYVWLGWFLLANSVHASEVDTWLTGIIVSSQNQVVSAPKGSNWRVQVQWMADEGHVVEQGELITVFDSGSIQADLELNEERLVMEQLELKQIESEQNQLVLEAEGRLKLAQINVKKQKIQTNVPDGEISAYDKGRYQIAFEKALVERIKAQELLTRTLVERDVAVEKQRIEITKLVEDIAYRKSQLKAMNVKANVTGPVTHMMHPYSNEKIAAGMNVNLGWDVMTVQAQQSYQVQTWIHERDAAQLDVKSAEILLSLDAYPGQTYPGKVLFMSSQTEPKKEWSDSAYFAIKIGFAQPPAQPLYPGMSVRIGLDNTAEEQN